MESNKLPGGILKARNCSLTQCNQHITKKWSLWCSISVDLARHFHMNFIFLSLFLKKIILNLPTYFTHKDFIWMQLWRPQWHTIPKHCSIKVERLKKKESKLRWNVVWMYSSNKMLLLSDLRRAKENDVFVYLCSFCIFIHNSFIHFLHILKLNAVLWQKWQWIVDRWSFYFLLMDNLHARQWTTADKISLNFSFCLF